MVRPSSDRVVAATVGEGDCGYVDRVMFAVDGGYDVLFLRAGFGFGL
jgi:hypothetical protein